MSVATLPICRGSKAITDATYLNDALASNGLAGIGDMYPEMECADGSCAWWDEGHGSWVALGLDACAVCDRPTLHLYHRATIDGRRTDVWECVRCGVRDEALARGEVTPMVEAPLYQHDCTRCVYLGRCDHDEDTYDLYWCDQGGGIPTVLARWSSDGPDYYSGMVFGATGEILPLGEAYRRAKERGLNCDVRG